MTFVGRLANRYARPLYQVATELGVGPRVLVELEAFAKLLAETDDLASILSLHTLSDGQRQGVLGHALAALDLPAADTAARPRTRKAASSPEAGEPDSEPAAGAQPGPVEPLPLTADFLRLLVRNERVGLLAEIIEALRNQLDAERNLVRAKVTTAVPMLKAEQTALASKLKEHFGAQSVDLTTVVDPAVVAGLVVHAEGEVIDASVRTYLRTMRDRLRQVRVAEFAEAGLLAPLRQAVATTPEPSSVDQGD